MKSSLKSTVLILPGVIVALQNFGCQLPPAKTAGPSQHPPATVLDPPIILETGAANLHRLFVSANEFAGFAFKVRSSKAVSKPGLAIKEATGPAGTEAFSISMARIHRVPVDRFPGWHVRSVPPAQRDNSPLDVLVPLHAPEGGMPSRLAAGSEHDFWFEVMAPKGTPPGEYVLPIVLESAGKAMGTLKVEMTVWPMALPDESDIAVIGEVGILDLLRRHAPSRSDSATGATVWHGDSPDTKFSEVVLSTFLMLQEHRVAPVPADLGPRVTAGARGEPAMDWSGYDRVVGPLLDGTAFSNRIPVPAWPLPVNQFLAGADSRNVPARNSRSDSVRFIRECADHFKGMGWYNRSFAFVNPQAQIDAASIAEVRARSGLIREAGPDLRVAVYGFPYDMKSYGWHDFPMGMADVQPDIWITDARFFEPQGLSVERSKGRRIWIKPDHPPFSNTTSLHARPADTLASGWLADHLGAEAIWLGRVNDWPEDSKAGVTQCARHSDQALLFPGTQFGIPGAVPTLRLKRVRESMQYLAYSRLLRQHGRGAVADSVRSALVHHAGTQAYRTHFADGRSGGWESDEQAYEVSRRLMAGQMLEVIGATSQGGASPPADGIAWRRTSGSANGPRLSLDGVRVRISGTPANAEAVVECWATIFNPADSPARLDVALVRIPPECEPAEAGRQLELGAGKSARALLSMNCEAGWSFHSRAPELAIELALANEPVRRIPVRPSVVVAEPISGRIKVDGDLSDWPPAAGNVATDFRLIAGECDDGREGCAVPQLRTFAFLRRDSENLYIGVNAQARPQTGSTARRTTLQYDELIPDDEEDLLELLIDPANSGTRSANDLYHIVIKRSGVSQSERGITTLPPLGPRRPWAPEMEVASRASSDRWTAEVRIPLAAFGRPGQVHGEIWGLNVTHFDAAGQEFSTWSGAVGNAYDPLSLGNLLLP